MIDIELLKGEYVTGYEVEGGKRVSGEVLGGYFNPNIQRLHLLGALILIIKVDDGNMHEELMEAQPLTHIFFSNATTLG